MSVEQCTRCNKEISSWESHHCGAKHYHRHNCDCGYSTLKDAEYEGKLDALKGIELKITDIGVLRPAKPKFESIVVKPPKKR